MLPLSGPVEGTIYIRVKPNKIERGYPYEDSLLNGDSVWAVEFGRELASGVYRSRK